MSSMFGSQQRCRVPERQQLVKRNAVQSLTAHSHKHVTPISDSSPHIDQSPALLLSSILYCATLTGTGHAATEGNSG
ncbi:hypothetical protein PBY51_007169 [Eleginops maclovinus]|uniref:Uncharacterized protein n=1 Tax=Eleginops maclovinus TaxID=56733 RepID=A0AAN7X348_ELEMC|nr:hypothetical protein PBY51_007169 [Eleginops maclovinus]